MGMNGIEMMMKSMGVDPEQIKKSLLDAKDQINTEVAALKTSCIDTQTKVIEIRIDLLRIEQKIDMLLLDATKPAQDEDLSHRAIMPYPGRFGVSDNG